MIILANTTDTLVLSVSFPWEALGYQGNVVVQVEYTDRYAANGVVGQTYYSNTTIKTSANTTIVSAPGTGIQRNINHLHIRNGDETHLLTTGTVPVAESFANLQVLYNADGTTYRLYSARTWWGDYIEYNGKNGFKTTGRPRIIQTVVLKGMTNNSCLYTQSLQGVDGASLILPGGGKLYGKTGSAYPPVIFFSIPFFQSVATTTGSIFGFDVNMPGGDTSWALTMSSSAITTVTQSVTGAAKAAGGRVGSSGFIIAQGTNPAITSYGIGFLAGGTASPFTVTSGIPHNVYSIQLMHASEVASSRSSLRNGSFFLAAQVTY